MSTETPRLSFTIEGMQVFARYTPDMLAQMIRHRNIEQRRRGASRAVTDLRTGAELLAFVVASQEIRRGWNRTLRTAVARWFNARSMDFLALQAVKNPCVAGWTLTDALRKANPKPRDEMRSDLYRWITHPEERGMITNLKWGKSVKRLIHAWDAAHLEDRERTPEEMARFRQRTNLPVEAIPASWLKHPQVWRVVYDDLPGRAVLNQLATLQPWHDPFDTEERIQAAVEKILDGAKRASVEETIAAFNGYVYATPASKQRVAIMTALHRASTIAAHRERKEARSRALDITSVRTVQYGPGG